MEYSSILKKNNGKIKKKTKMFDDSRSIHNLNREERKAKPYFEKAFPDLIRTNKFKRQKNQATFQHPSSTTQIKEESVGS